MPVWGRRRYRMEKTSLGTIDNQEVVEALASKRYGSPLLGGPSRRSPWNNRGCTGEKRKTTGSWIAHIRLEPAPRNDGSPMRLNHSVPMLIREACAIV